ncbi:MAG: methyl-accepting chemotaxis protein [Spirochaetales bacterium]|nr:methyl-accepting chemotaxis protein [Spirochaetales bacterium]
MIQILQKVSSVRQRLLGLAVISIVFTLLLSGIILLQVTQAAQTQAEERLTILRDTKARQVKIYLETVENEILTLAESLMTISALQEFDEAFAAIESDSPNQQRSTQAASRIQNYVETEFFSRVADFDRSLLEPATAYIPQGYPSRILQETYITGNPNHVGQKDSFVGGRNTPYDEHHRRYHPVIRNFLQRYGFYDIFLVEPENGYIVYSVFKELDYATSLENGPYANTGLARVYQGVKTNPRPGQVVLDDFAPYPPSYFAPAAFIGAPIYEGSEFLGVLIFQFSIDALNQTMTSEGQWLDEGYGVSGETFLTNQSGQMITDSRFFLEDLQGMVEALGRVPEMAEAAKRIETRGSMILNFEIQTPGVTLAAGGQRGIEEFVDYRGVPVLSAYRQLDYDLLPWLLFAEIDTDEAFQSVRDVTRIVGVSTLVILAALILIILGVSQRISVPISRAAVLLTEIAQGDGDLTRRMEPSRVKELQVMSESFNTFTQSLANIVQNIRQVAEEAGSVGQNLSSASEEAAAASYQIQQNMDSITQQIQNLDQNIQVTSSAADEIRAVAEGFANEVSLQRKEVTRTLEEVAFISRTTEEVDQLVKDRQGQAASLVTQSHESSEAIENTTRLIRQVQGAAEKITAATKVIEDISARTNLLAMNAAIEAAHAGNAGKGFGVVAGEIRNLSNSTKENAQVISQNLKEVVDQIVKAQEASMVSSQSFSAILSGIESFASSFIQVAQAMAELTQRSSTIVQSLTKLEQSASQTEGGGQEMKVGIQSIIEGIFDIRQISANVASSTEEINGGIREITQAMHMVADQGQRNRDYLDSIQAHVKTFII